MNKSKNFSGQPIIKQILSFVSSQNVYRTAEEYKSDRYTKRFTTHEHLVTMMFAVLSGCNSLREVTSIILACEGKISHLGIKHFPRRSTLADANKRREMKYLERYTITYIISIREFYRTAERSQRRLKG